MGVCSGNFGLTSIKPEVRRRDRGNKSQEGGEYCRLDLLVPTVTQGTTNLRQLVVLHKVLSTAPNS